MAVNRLDLRARLVGFLFFLPILLPVLAGHPFAVIGTCLAAIWVIYEACTVLGAGVSSAKKRVAMLALMLIFHLIEFAGYAHQRLRLGDAASGFHAPCPYQS